MDINVVTFAYFQTSDGELLGRSMLLDESQVETRAKSRSKRPPPRSWEELEGLAEKQGVLDLYKQAVTGLRPLFDGANRTRANVAFVGNVGDSRSRNTILSVFPEVSSEEKGLVIGFSMDRLTEYFSANPEEVESVTKGLGRGEDVWWHSAYFFGEDRLNRLLELLGEGKNAVAD